MKQNRYKIKIASYLILKKDNKILLSRRFNTNWADGMYSLPAGHIDEGETPLETIIREAKEEVDVLISPLNTRIVHIHFQRDVYVDFYFETTEWTGKIIINEPDKCDKIIWVKVDEIENYQIAEKVIKVLLSIRNGDFYSEGD